MARRSFAAATVLLLAQPACAAAMPVGFANGRVLSSYHGTPLAVVSGATPSPYVSATDTSLGSGVVVAAVEREHVVQPGETMWRIARIYGMDPSELARKNGIDDPAQLRAGRKLRIPAPGGRAVALAPAGTRPASPDAAESPQANPPQSPTAAALARARVASLGQPPPAVPTAKPSQPSVTAPAADTKPEPSSKPTLSTPPQKPAAASKGGKRYPYAWPVEGEVTSRYGARWGRTHDGIDISAPRGTAIHAAAAAEVLYAAPHGSYGNLVVLKHSDGMVTIYAHTDVNLVRKGQRVEAGQTIAKVGATGRATGPHLHFEVRRGTKPENPMRFLPP